eukprot:gnl/Hemi2/25399_TR8550_c0_g1_i1.p1 gnl/Hemi2/25399_TR8550_c0_g1~~gnl/Hemi2/25399_TR8550_c0_g1_i1.p1  ORF type:complete len:674 (-),score=172.52 gnl/Hemi2/25399_TR8550_c0_g1_i1:69-1976(-)
MDSRDTVDAINKEFNKNALLEPINKLEEQYSGIQEEAQRIFGPLLQRKKECDKIREVLGIFKRVQSLFNLPTSVKNNIANRNYDQAIRDYQKAKTLISNTTEDNILRKVLLEVEKHMTAFKAQLLRDLEQPLVYAEEHQRTLGYLMELDSTEDPAWHYLTKQHAWLLRTLKDIIDNKATTGSTGSLGREAFTPIRSSYSSTGSAGASSDDAVHAAKVTVTKLCQFLTKHLPGFWKITLSLLTGDKFAARESAITEMIRSILVVYQKGVKNLIFSSHQAVVHVPLLLGCVPGVISCYRSLAATDMPAVLLQDMFSLVTELSRAYIEKTFALYREEALQLVLQETWVVDRENDFTTALPQTWVLGLTRTLAGLHGPVSSVCCCDDSLSALFQQNFFESLNVFADIVHQLVFESEVAEEVHLLVAAQNLSHVLDSVVPNLLRKFCSDFYPTVAPSAMERSLKGVVEVYRLLESMVMDVYLKRKILKLNTVIANSMLREGVDWAHKKLPKELRESVFYPLLHLVGVHAEVRSGSPLKYLGPVMSRLYEALLLQYSQCYRALAPISEEAGLQLMCEIEFVENCLLCYKTPLSETRLQGIYRDLEFTLDGEAGRQLNRERLVKDALARTVAQFDCFVPPVG